MNEETLHVVTQNPRLGDQTSMKTHNSFRRFIPAGLMSLTLGMLSGTAYGQAAAALPTEPTETSAQSPELQRALKPLSWKKAPGRRVAFGIEDGMWGKSWGQGLRVTVPFTSYFGATLRGVYLIDMTMEGPFTADAGGRFELIGRSDVFFNVMRLYGGGGVQVLAPAANTAGREVQVGGGGQFGFEFFCSPHQSFFLEVGGQGPGPSPGATVMAGMNIYPWTR